MHEIDINEKLISATVKVLKKIHKSQSYNVFVVIFLHLSVRYFVLYLPFN